MSVTVLLLLLAAASESPVRLDPGMTWHCRGEARLHEGGAPDGTIVTVPLEFDVRATRPEGEAEGVVRIGPAYMGMWGLPEAQLLQLPEDRRATERENWMTSDVVRISDDAVTLVRCEWPPSVGQTLEFGDAWLLWKRELAEEDSWTRTITLSRGSGGAEMTSAVEPEQDLQTALGALTAIPVSFRFGGTGGASGHRIEGRTWFSPGRGPVKQEYEFYEGGAFEIAVQWEATGVEGGSP